jgi:hypothetical protein
MRLLLERLNGLVGKFEIVINLFLQDKNAFHAEAAKTGRKGRKRVSDDERLSDLCELVSATFA